MKRTVAVTLVLLIIFTALSVTALAAEPPDNSIQPRFNHRYEKTIVVPYLWPNGIQPTSYPPYMYYEEVFDSAGGIAKGTLSFVSASPVPSEKMSNLTYTGIPVSYTHLDVYKRQAGRGHRLCGQHGEQHGQPSAF